MESVYHEKQEGSLCAQHCLNSLLQEPTFTAVDLASFAQQLDEAEAQRMAEGGTYTDDYARFNQQPSTNMDDSGYFSVQVIDMALNIWNLKLVPYKSREELAVQAQQFPNTMNAYICNYKEHWFTIRKLGQQWFNLNSLLTGPELLSNTYLSVFLAQLEQEGYSIFIIKGELAQCAADVYLQNCPVIQTERPRLISEMKPEEYQVKEAMKKSIEESFRNALQNSLLDQTSPRQGTSTAPDPEELRNQRLRYFDGSQERRENLEEGMTEQEMLEKAIKMSMES